MLGLPGLKEDQDKTTKRSELVEILATWTATKQLKVAPSTKKNFKVPRSTPSKLPEKD